MTKKERVLEIIKRLKIEYPKAECSLQYEDPVQLLICTRLSAQCTDARVNAISPALFERFPTLQDFAKATPEEVEPYIYSCGFYHGKARDIVGMCQMLQNEYKGIVPDTIEELVKLPGVGRKTANLIVGDIYHKPSVVTDTHCIRITNRLKLASSENPAVCEKQLRTVLPPEESTDFCHRIVQFGRDTCESRNPKCEGCILQDLCSFKK
ncbi:MAG: endonuclease III [Clostridia bacterium]|nr:endonuclease III [Clostridia bacterium]